MTCKKIDTISVDVVLNRFDEYKEECDKPSNTKIIVELIGKYYKENNANDEDGASDSKNGDRESIQKDIP